MRNRNHYSIFTIQSKERLRTNSVSTIQSKIINPM
uniref:Uncharacterized protein n=1 Tax=Rhizophora mucronata TaxID=61149 RepID=A0A2P2QGT9_RHIMU